MGGKIKVKARLGGCLPKKTHSFTVKVAYELVHPMHEAKACKHCGRWKLFPR